MPVTTNSGPEISKSARDLPAFAQPAFERGQRDLADVPLGRETVEDDAVGDLARDLGHQLADRGEERPSGSPYGLGPGLKNGVISVWR